MTQTIIASIPKNINSGILESYRIVEQVILVYSGSKNRQIYERHYVIQSTPTVSQEWQDRALTGSLFKALFTLAYICKSSNECYDVNKLIKSIDDESISP